MYISILLRLETVYGVYIQSIFCKHVGLSAVCAYI